MAFFEYHHDRAEVVARRAVVESVEQMLETFSGPTQEAFARNFAEPMTRAAKVRSWRDLPPEKLHDLHDLCARTPTAVMEATKE